MLSFIAIFIAAYVALYQALPLFNGPLYQADHLAQALRHLVLLYLANQFANFLWRHKFVSRSVRILSREYAKE